MWNSKLKTHLQTGNDVIWYCHLIVCSSIHPSVCPSSFLSRLHILSRFSFATVWCIFMKLGILVYCNETKCQVLHSCGASCVAIKVKVTVEGDILHLGFSERYIFNRLMDCNKTWYCVHSYLLIHLDYIMHYGVNLFWSEKALWMSSRKF